jgi:hypothetical protein
MKAIRTLSITLAASSMLLVATATATAASARVPGRHTCSGGSIASGTYRGLTVTGTCKVPDGATVTVRGNLEIAEGAAFNAVTNSTVHITGNVRVEDGATFGLGCTIMGVGNPPCTMNTADVVDGNVVLDEPRTMYLDGSAVHGNVTSTGGGPGNTATGLVNFVIKDNTIGGNVRVEQWQGFWIGLLRNTIGGTVTLHENATANPDSTEVVHNTIGGNLRCSENSPMAQFGDAVDGAPPGYGFNIVTGHARGECATLVAP